jgi:hypothetical protein
VGASATGDPGSALNPASVFFDNRTNYVGSMASLTWLQSSKTSFTMRGDGFFQDRKEAAGLTNAWGYNLTGGVSRRLSKANSVGANYTHSHFEFPGFGSVSDSNAYHGTFASNFARFWSLSVEAGAVVSEVQSPFTVTLNPILAIIYGQKTISGVSFVRNIYPSGSATLKRQFQRAALSFSYQRTVNSGNGFSTTSRQEMALAGLSYTGIRKLSLSVDGGYYNLINLGQFTGRTTQFSGGGGLSYNILRATYLNLRYDYRDQQVDISGYGRHGSRATIGLAFSPGKIPLSMW